MSNASKDSNSSSPVKPAVLSGYEAAQSDAKGFRKHLADAMTGLFVGPMPVEQFLDDFLPPALQPPPELPTTFFNDMGPKFKKESDMCKKLEEYIPKDLIPGFQIVNTSNHEDPDSTKRIKPDPTMYRADLDTTSKRTQFSEIELHFELKKDRSCDPFDDGPKSDFEATGQDRLDCRGQLISYATEWCARQHRRFAFTVFMADPFVRFIRWDRSGAVVSARLDYREDSTPLIQFLWRFCNLDRAGRGWDPTVYPANPHEVTLAHDHLSKWKNDLHRDVMVFEVLDGGEKRKFIGWGSMAYPESLTGRCTRAYPVYEEKNRRLYFLKDSWRAEGLEKESAILRALRENNVRHIPGFVCGDDLLDDATVTDLYVPVQVTAALPKQGDVVGDPSVHVGEENNAAAGASGADTSVFPKRNGSWRHGTNWSRITRRYHHRMVTDVIGHHLKKFSSSKQMMQVVSHAFTAHQDAYTKCTIIHRDISSYNILITDDGHGILNDWDLAKYEKDIVSNWPRQHERTGTWQFMSCLLLKTKDKPHTIQDDMESFFYVVLYHSIRYLQHNKSETEIYEILKYIFDQHYFNEGARVGGSTKEAMLRLKGEIAPLTGFEVVNHVPLNQWITDALDIVGDWLLAVASTKRPPPTEEKRKELLLYTHQPMIDLFDSCLSLPGWPPNDEAVDRLPVVTEKSLTVFKSAAGSSTGSGSMKRSRPAEELDESEASECRPKKKAGGRSKASGGSRSYHNGGR